MFYSDYNNNKIFNILYSISLIFYFIFRFSVDNHFVKQKVEKIMSDTYKNSMVSITFLLYLVKIYLI